MPSPRRLSLQGLPIRFVARLAAIVTAWLVIVGAGVACFSAQADTGAQPLSFDLIGFGISLAIAGAVAAAVALVVGGEKRTAAEVVLAVSLAILVSAALGFLVLWVAPSILRDHLDAWSFLRLRDRTRLGSAEILRFQAPLAARVGLVLGLGGGLLILLSRWRPRLAIAMAYGLLFACAVGPVQRSGLDIVIAWGWIIRRSILSWGLVADLISALGAVFGAIAGAVSAGFWVYQARRRASPTPR
jgi:hypothetical protein